MVEPMEITMNALRPGNGGRVTALTTVGPMRRRLLDLGFVPGAAVESLFRNAGGSLTAYAVRGAVIALRPADARTVRVSI